MAWILCIETSGDVCSAALSSSGQTIAQAERRERNIHASILTSLVDEVMQKAGIGMKDLSAVAVSKGPGSYTGLRVGVSTAKGICYALGIPLIAVNTLHLMAEGFYAQNPDTTALLCPMIDARRMEVYMAVFNAQMETEMPVTALILDENSFSAQKNQPIIFLGSGAFKMQQFLPSFSSARVETDFLASASFISMPAFNAFSKKQFEDIAYFEPFYLKDFVGTTPRKKIEA